MLTVTQLAKECPKFYAALRSITVFRKHIIIIIIIIILPSVPWSP